MVFCSAQMPISSQLLHSHPIAQQFSKSLRDLQKDGSLFDTVQAIPLYIQDLKRMSPSMGYDRTGKRQRATVQFMHGSMERTRDVLRKPMQSQEVDLNDDGLVTNSLRNTKGGQRGRNQVLDDSARRTLQTSINSRVAVGQDVLTAGSPLFDWTRDWDPEDPQKLSNAYQNLYNHLQITQDLAGYGHAFSPHSIMRGACSDKVVRQVLRDPTMSIQSAKEAVAEKFIRWNLKSPVKDLYLDADHLKHIQMARDRAKKDGITPEEAWDAIRV